MAICLWGLPCMSFHTETWENQLEWTLFTMLFSQLLSKFTPAPKVTTLKGKPLNGRKQSVCRATWSVCLTGCTQCGLEGYFSHINRWSRSDTRGHLYTLWQTGVNRRTAANAQRALQLLTSACSDNKQMFLA